MGILFMLYQELMAADHPSTRERLENKARGPCGHCRIAT